MSNALRLFIRESLTNEAVGQVTFMRRDDLATKVTKGGSVTDEFMKGLGKVGTTGLGRIKGAASRAWQGRSKTKTARNVRAAAGMSFLSLAVAGLTSLWGASPDGSDTAASGESSAGAFEAEITEIINKSSADIIGDLRTPAIKSGLNNSATDEEKTAAITAYETNYSKHADAITAAATTGAYASFFTKMPSFNSCKVALDAAITEETRKSADVAVKKDLESFVLNYLIYHAICFTNTDSASASGLDAAALEAAGFIEDNTSNQTAYDNLTKVKDSNLAQANKINGNAACVAVIDQFSTQ
jgi:hypothetical protein